MAESLGRKLTGPLGASPNQRESLLVTMKRAKPAQPRTPRVRKVVRSGHGKAPLIVGIGASAGGLDAFKSFFENAAADTGMGFVLVQHLSPDYKSMLAELLGKVTSMDVIEATDGVAVKANCVFVIPPDATMTIANGCLKIVKPAPPRERRRPIDTFFQSLAEDQGENAVCIILSGTGSDGTLGASAIKEHGGLTLAQSEYDSHALPGMPQSAAATGQVDDVLAVEEMPAKLVAYQAHLKTVATSKDDGGVRTDIASQMATIMGALRARSGHDFSEYKEKTLLRRLQRRMQLLQVETPVDYIKHFRDQPEELDALFRELLIGVTQFFRDPAAFEALDATVLQALVAGESAQDTVRVWVPGCATGEEVFTLAILLSEAMDSQRPKPKIQIFGTDIDDRAIAAARAGCFRKPMTGVSTDRLERWFTPDGDGYCVLPEIREMCVFSTQSVIKDPPFSKLDLISCRNLLIYIDPTMQDRVMRTFHYALRPGGKLFLGTSESVTRTARLFAPLDKKNRIFDRCETERTYLPELPARGSADEGAAKPKIRPQGAGDRIEKGARRQMEKYYPPHVVIDLRHQIVRFSGGSMGQYLEPSPGAPSFALFDILRKPLRPAVRALLLEVHAANAPVRHADVTLRIDGRPHLLTLIAEPIDDDSNLIVLAFQDNGPRAPKDPLEQSGNESTDNVRALEQELRTTRTQLQSTIDELEVASEEMKSSNEEYQSVNEELQSANEELETSKEEMQSVNEELQTINVEMLSKNAQLTHLNSDIKNLLESTDIATLFLDDKLRIKSFTGGISDIFSVRAADVGRPITEIVNLLDYADLQRDVRTVLRKLSVIERRVALKDAAMSFEMRIRPYRAIDNVIDGVVCTFTDITAREAADAILRESERQFHALAESIPQLAWIMDAKGYIFWYNQRWFDYTNTNLGDMKGWGWKSVQHPDEVDRVAKHLQHCIEAGVVWEDTFSIRGADGNYRWFLSRAEPIRDEGGKIVRWFGTNTDIEEQRRSEKPRQLLLNEMDHRVKNVFAIVGGVVTLSARSAKTPQEMVTTIQGRLGALASAHLLIRASKSGLKVENGSTLELLIRAVLAPYENVAETDSVERFVIKGPEVPIGGDAVTSLALVLHELATNAAKYGAFSTPDGQVQITWKVAKKKLSLQWKERGGPALHGPPAREGFGSLLARRSMNGQLNGELSFDWQTEGLTVHFSAATERLSP